MTERKGWKDHRHRLHQALSAPGLSNGQRMTLFCLVDLMDWKDESMDPQVKVRKSKLCIDRHRKDTNNLRKKIKNDLDALETKGYITTTESYRENSSQESNVYTVHLRKFLDDLS